MASSSGVNIQKHIWNHHHLGVHFRFHPFLVDGFNPIQNICQIGSSPQVGANIKNIRNHHLGVFVPKRTKIPPVDVLHIRPPNVPGPPERVELGEVMENTPEMFTALCVHLTQGIRELVWEWGDFVKMWKNSTWITEFSHRSPEDCWLFPFEMVSFQGIC